MTTREQFIGAVSRALGRMTVPSAPEALVYRHTVHIDAMQTFTQDALARLFVDRSRAIGAEVFETKKDELKHTLRQAVARCSPGVVIMADDPLLKEIAPDIAPASERTVHFWGTGDSREEEINFAEKASVGIAVARLAMAESATVLIFGSEGCGRSVTLLPETTILVIPKSVIRPRLTQGMAYVREHTGNLPSSVNFISGPSATSDIELVRVVGVHGPVRVIHAVVHDM